MLFAQAVFVIGCFMCLFAFVKHKVTGFLMIFVFAVAVLGSYRFVLSGLYVDVLLPLVGLTGILIGIYYDTDINRVLWAILPETVFLIAVKNSGLVLCGCYHHLCVDKDKMENSEKRLGGSFHFCTISYVAPLAKTCRFGVCKG